MGILTFVAAVLAAVDVQKRNATLNGLHLGFMIVITLITSIASLIDLAVHKFALDTTNHILAAVILGMLVLEVPIVVIAVHRYRVASGSFHQDQEPPPKTSGFAGVNNSGLDAVYS